MASAVRWIYRQHLNALPTPFVVLDSLHDHFSIKESRLDHRLLACVVTGGIVQERLIHIEQSRQFNFLSLLLAKALNRCLAGQEVFQLQLEELQDGESETSR